MNLKSLLKFGAIHLSVLTIALFIRFSGKENEDMSAAILETMVYLPFLVGLVVLNLGMLSFGLVYFNDKLRPFVIILTSLVLLVWYSVSNGQLEVYNWKLTQAEFWYINLILLFLNFRAMSSLKKQQENEDVPE